MLAYLQQATAYLAMLLIVSRTASGLAAGEHAHLFHNLCELLTAPTRISQTPDDTYMAKTDYLDILQLNTSLSDAEWRKKFAKPGQGKPRPEYTTPKAGEDTIQKERWQDWLEAEDALDGPNKAAAMLKHAGLDSPSNQDRDLYLQLLQPISEKAAAINADLITLTQETGEDTVPKIIAALNTGLFGKAESTALALDNNILKNTATDHVGLCGTQGTSAKAHALVTIALCVCGNGAASGAQDLCVADQDDSNLDGGLNNLNTLGQDLVKHCQASSNTITSAELTAAISSLIGNFQSKGTNMYIGYYSSTGCNGNTANGVCAMYKTDSKSDVEKINNMPWRKELIKASNLLHSREAKRAQILAGNQKLQKLKTLAFSLAPQVQLIKRQQAQQKALEPLTKANKEEQTSKECEAIEKAKLCKEKKPLCEWKGENDGDGEYCKLNATHVAQQAPTQAGGTGGNGSAGEQKKEEKCKGQPEKDCKSPDCKWEGTECKDSSILVNKKLVLSMAAAFVGLVVF
uniref:Variant surface glycoprotein 1125.174 n=1 Tax=Trypanosoma brucei TaxID=5691 RepID=A0A1J0R5B7_9TRYP|nr:variant surface glycoprotein 1125.174 [Trypanosoma brucei]